MEKKSYETFDQDLAAARETMLPVQLADRREELIVKGLREIAAECGVTLRKHMRIDGNGEIMIVAESPEYKRGDGCSQFGEKFAEVLNKYPVRTGVVFTTGHVMPNNGWLLMNHFDAEKLVSDFAK